MNKKQRTKMNKQKKQNREPIKREYGAHDPVHMKSTKANLVKKNKTSLLIHNHVVTHSEERKGPADAVKSMDDFVSPEERKKRFK